MVLEIIFLIIRLFGISDYLKYKTKNNVSRLKLPLFQVLRNYQYADLHCHNSTRRENFYLTLHSGRWKKTESVN